MTLAMWITGGGFVLFIGLAFVATEYAGPCDFGSLAAAVLCAGVSSIFLFAFVLLVLLRASVLP